MQLSRNLFLVLALALFMLTSCGGGGGGGVDLPPDVTKTPTTGASEGSTSSPKDLGTTAVAYPSGTVGYGGMSYYQFTTTSAGSYIISLTNTTVKMEWQLFAQKSDLGYITATDIASQDDIFTSPRDLVAVAPNLDANRTYYLMVTDWDTSGGTYHISIVNGSSEGSKNNPVALTPDGSAHSGGIDMYGYSYYTFTTTGGTYNIDISGLSVPTNSLTWTLYSDAGFTTPIPGLTCNDVNVAGPINCAAPNLAAGTYYLSVHNYYSYATQPTAYTIAVVPDSIGYYATPVFLPLDTHVTGTVLENEMNHYYVNLPTPGAYTFTIGTLENISWELYSDPGYSSLVKSCAYQTSMSGQTNCSTGNIAHGTYYLRLINNYSAPVAFDLIATGQGGSEGAVGDPVQLTSRATYSGGKVTASGASYYSFQTEALSASAPYLIALSSPGYWVSWTIYSDAAYTSTITSCNSTNWSNDVVCSTSEPNGSAPLLPGTTYYVKVTGSSSSASTYSVKVSPLAAPAGCSAGGTCYGFEGGALTPFTGTWSAVTGTAGSGTSSVQSGMSNAGKQSSNCFNSANLTDVKYVVFSLHTNLGGFSDTLGVYLDGWTSGGVLNEWSGANEWQRVVVRVFSGGSHYYQWCQLKNAVDNFVDNNAWVDDVEFVY